MASAMPKDHSAALHYPRALSRIVISVGFLGVFIFLASWVLLSHPIGSVVRNYFYGVDQTSDVDSPVSWNSGHIGEVLDGGKPEGVSANLPKSESGTEDGPSRNGGDGGQPGSGVSSKVVSTAVPKSEAAIDVSQSRNAEEGEKLNPRGSSDKTSPHLPNIKGEGVIEVGSSANASDIRKPGFGASISDGSRDAGSAGLPKSETPQNNSNHHDAASDCDLYQGEWFYDPTGPVYTNNSCPIITQMQNCQGNGRPDKEYENWRWKPSQCELPRFNGTKFLELMSGKTLAFVGDSVARNQMESLLCLLWQVEVPKNRGNRHMQRWFFRSKSVWIVRIWSSWLVHQTGDPFSYAPAGVAKLHLDLPDEHFMEYVPNFDVVILSSGHWFAKQSVYILNNEIVGTQLWAPPKQEKMKINSIEAFGISVDTSVTAMATHPNYTGITIIRSYSPDHYEGGAWNTGGSCTGKEKPVLPGKLVENGFTNSMHEQQVRGFHKAAKKQTNKSKLKLMDITGVFSYRHDGHPGPYRSPDPNKITKRGPDGRPPPQDCLHWCMPGPVDTWNELVLEIIRREYEGIRNAAFKSTQ